LLPFLSKGNLKIVQKSGKLLKVIDGKTVRWLGEVRPYKQLRKLIKKTGKEAHHLIEKRFARRLGIDPDDIPAAMMLPGGHRGEGESFTNLMRKQIEYGKNYDDIPIQKIYEAHRDAYKKYGAPEVMEAINNIFHNAGAKIE
jgi:hypothetical protein